ncbi:septum formation inhibitor Maf, partial [Shigella flexneri]|nr:septum formation inhibitor Maf [Shigella flexneri]EGD6260603.1 septum formation inhibitor Maf [Shigella flexneri]EGE1261101.1 septum formation inhibitor Maf [Shigella flexneri]EGE1389145.1 septum formation inhibitor Maf [Shigella flexneri]
RAEESPENETNIALCDLLICANNSMRSLLCLFIKYVRISSGMP